MKRFLKLSLGIACFCLPLVGIGQTFFKHYPTLYDRTARDVYRNADGTYLIVGSSNNSNQADMDLYVIRTSADGTFLWDTVYGGSKPDYAYHMTPTDDGNYIVVGFTQSFGGGDYDIYMLKLSPMGMKLAERHLDFGGKNDEARQVIRTSDNHYMVVGTTGMPPSSGKSQIVLLKVDNNLIDVVSPKFYGGSDNDYGLCIAQTSDGFVLGGQTFSDHNGAGDAYIVKIDDSLNEQWSNHYGSALAQEVVGLVVNQSDNTAMLAIRDSMPGEIEDGDIDVVLQKVNLANNGATVGGEHRFGGEAKDTPKTIMPVSTGGFIVGAISRSGWADAPQMWLIRTDGDGNEQWIYDFGDQYEHDHAHMAKESFDGGFISVGHQRAGGIMKLAFLKINGWGTVDLKENGGRLTGITLFPNPSSTGNFSLSFPESGNYQVEIFNIVGQEVYKNVVNLQQPGVYSVELPSKQAGIYIVNVKSGDKVSSAKLIVE